MNALKLLPNKLSMGIFQITHFCTYSQESLARSKLTAYDKWFSPYSQHPLEKKSGHQRQVICDCGATQCTTALRQRSIKNVSHTFS